MYRDAISSLSVRSRNAQRETPSILLHAYYVQFVSSAHAPDFQNHNCGSSIKCQLISRKLDVCINDAKYSINYIPTHARIDQERDGN